MKPLAVVHIKKMKSKKREDDMLNYIKSFMLENGYTPTIRQIGYGVHLRSTSSVHVYFERLVNRGDIILHGKNYSVRGMKYVVEGCED